MGAGRTDAGVHATGQVIAFTYPGSLSAEDLTEALNGNLPPDVAVRDLRRAPAGFNPRYAARYREYRYTIWNGPRSPLRERTALWVRVELDIAAMARAATALEGRHDFSAFGGADPQPVRTVHRIRVRRTGSQVTIDVRADAFLRGMVRRIVATLLAVGTGRLEASAVGALLTAGTPALDGAAAPARGLCLRRVVLGRRDGRTGTAARTRTRTTQDTRSDERQDVHRARRRHRAQLVRRGRDRPDARPPRHACRACPRGQAQADLVAEPRRRGSRDRPQREEDLGERQRSTTRSRTSATAATRRASRRSPSASCSSGGPRRSSAGRSRACSRTPGSARSSCASSRSTPDPTIPIRPSGLSRSPDGGSTP